VCRIAEENVDKGGNNVTSGPGYGFFRYFIIFVVMEYKFWLYVIIGGIYVLSRILKKNSSESTEIPQSPRPEPKREPGRPQTDIPRQLTFEELLKELTEAKTAAKPVTPPASQRNVVDYDDDVEEEEKDLETIEPDYSPKKGTYKVYEEAKTQAFSRPSLEETMKVADTKVEFGKFKVFEEQKKNNLLEEYTSQFQDPEGLKRAVVMGEILNRRFQY